MKALVLGGGGVKGAYQAGLLVIDAATKSDMDYQVLAGTSIGAIGAAILATCNEGPSAFRRRVRDFARLWTEEVESSDDVYSPRCLGWLSGFFKMSLNTTEPLQQILEEYVDPDKIIQSGRRLRVGVWNASQDIYFEARETSPYMREMVRASAAFPLLLEPIWIEGDAHVDGGVRNNLPSSFLREPEIQGNLEQIDIILTGPINPSSGKRVHLGNLKDMALRTLEALVNEAGMNDLLPFLSYGMSNPDCKIRIAAPKEPLDANVLDISAENNQALFREGNGGVWEDFYEFFQRHIDQ